MIGGNQVLDPFVSRLLSCTEGLKEYPPYCNTPYCNTPYCNTPYCNTPSCKSIALQYALTATPLYRNVPYYNTSLLKHLLTATPPYWNTPLLEYPLAATPLTATPLYCNTPLPQHLLRYSDSFTSRRQLNQIFSFELLVFSLILLNVIQTQTQNTESKIGYLIYNGSGGNWAGPGPVPVYLTGTRLVPRFFSCLIIGFLCFY